MDSAKKFSLQWNEYKTSIKKTFGGLRKTGDYSDITLTCEDGQQIEAHKVVLSSSCIFFSELLKKNPHSHPLVYMRGVKLEDLSAIIDFIYLGETEVMKENLETFLEIAGELGVQGMTKQNSNKSVKDQLKTNSIDSELGENPSDVDGLVTNNRDKKFSEIEPEVANLDEKAKARFECNFCGTYYSTKDLLSNHKKEHIEKAKRSVPSVGVKRLDETMDYLYTDTEDKEEVQVEEVGEDVEEDVEEVVEEDVEEDELQDEEEQQNDKQVEEELRLEDEPLQEMELQEEMDDNMLQDINRLNDRKQSDNSSVYDGCDCDMCGKTFDNDGLLNIHKYREHNKIGQQDNIEGDNPNASVVCNICGKSYNTRDSLMCKKHKHIKKEDLSFPSVGLKKESIEGMIKSEDLDQSSREVDELERRIDALTEKRESVWTCIQCGKSDKSRFHLRRHTESHIEGFTFACNRCDKTYPHRNPLKSHVLRSHPEDRAAKPFTCDICSSEHKTKSAVGIHKKKNHMSEPSIECF